jgi:ketosteroid isomerase-like protein
VPTTSSDPSAGVDAFNRALIDATRRMDDAAVLALWADDGVSLLPGTPPVEGKPAITAFLSRVHAELPDAKMRSFEMRCSGLVVAGDTASEYCEEHQVVDLGAGKAPFDGVGRMLFALHRGSDGKWRAVREMWQPMKMPAPSTENAGSSPAPAGALGCGDLALRAAELQAMGKGENHPQVIAVRSALERCADRAPSPEACARVRQERVEMEASGYGPRHPRMLVSDAQTALCSRVTASPRCIPDCQPGDTPCSCL